MAERGMRVVVAGAGVAGAASAIALARIGADVTVYEAYADPAGSVGSFVSLAVNGLRALDVLGVLAPVQAAGFDVERHRMWSGRGKLLGDVPRGRRSGDALPGATLHSVTLMRADLVTALRDEAAAAGARIVTGHRLTRAAQTRDALSQDALSQDALSQDALSQACPDSASLDRADLDRVGLDRTDLVVGADGIWSDTRRALDPGAPEPAYAGLYSVSGISGEVPGISRDDRGQTGPSSWNMIFGRRGAFIYLPAPDGRIWWSAQVSAPQPPPDLAAVTAAELATVFRAEERAVAILDAAREVHAATLHHVLAPVPRRYGRGTVLAADTALNADIVLVGDAAHPAGAGQGASMAIEDAVVLAAQLRHARPLETYVPSDTVETYVPKALAAFDALRRGRAGKLAKTAASSNEAKTAGPVAARMRDIIMPVMVPRFYEKATAWLYDYDLAPLPARRTPTGAT
jgi:2-polyprenyl-6-methoxyphenol hydroxylase-like FAD-dependent oxidoreductase